MKKYLAVVAFVLVSTVANAQSYSDVIRTCGAEWRERTDKTVKGRDAWNEFRKECTARKGYVTKAQKRNEGFARVPDKQ